MHNHVKWSAIAVPALMVGIFEYFRHQWFDHRWPGHWGNVVGALIVAAGVYGFVRYFTEVVTRSEQDLGRSRAEAAVLAERQRIAREMHDGVAQALFHLRVRLEEVERHAASGSLATVQEEVANLQHSVHQAYDQVRSAISGLKQYNGAEDTAEALRRGALGTASELGVAVQLDLNAVPRLDANAQQHLLAIVQEAITNAHRHGHASTVTVSSDDQRLIITDNGGGFDPRQVPDDRFGLLIMAERAKMIGGHLQVEARPGEGARLTLHWGVHV